MKSAGILVRGEIGERIRAGFAGAEDGAGLGFAQMRVERSARLVAGESGRQPAGIVAHTTAGRRARLVIGISGAGPARVA
jgi:hypothetical protein